MSKIPYAKPVRTLDEQIELLRDRGLTIDDEATAKRYLDSISYYRLSGYTRYFTRNDDDRRERFREGITFENVIELYVFDRKLRTLLCEAFERIEVAVKGSVAYHGAVAAGAFWATDPANFDQGRFPEVIKLVTEAVEPHNGKRKTQFLEAFYNKYSDNYPPVWMLTEVLSFHGASIIFKLSRGYIRKPVADQFGVHQDILESWLHALVFARNVCAHHQRFWNRKFTIKPKIPHIYRPYWPEQSQNRVYLTCCIVKHMLSHIAGDTTWALRLRELIRQRPPVPLADLGFPEDWEASPYWSFPVEA